MSIFILYIGKNNDNQNHFRSMLGDGIVTVSNILEAKIKLEEVDPELPLLFFFEKGKIKSDLQTLEYIRNNYPNAYLILIADRLEKEEILQYQKAGIKDTSTPDISFSRLKNGIEFVINNQEIISSVNYSKEPLGMYVIPLWKRVFDIFFSVIAIIFLSPLLLLTAVLILIESRGPVIYKSKRVGSNYVVFDFLKFRSMYRDADQRLKDYLTLNQYREEDIESLISAQGDESIVEVSDFSTDVVCGDCYVSDDEVLSEDDYIKEKRIKNKNNFVKFENDPRITRVGKIIRKFSIDELPQLINVLKGDMSIVGNRPLPLYEAEKLTSDEYIDRFLAPSGLTGLWQVEKRGDSGKLSPEERKQLDVYYANNFSFWMDIKIIVKTFTAFIQKENV